jgi:hypothetical protein
MIRLFLSVWRWLCRRGAQWTAGVARCSVPAHLLPLPNCFFPYPLASPDCLLQGATEICRVRHAHRLSVTHRPKVSPNTPSCFRGCSGTATGALAWLVEPSWQVFLYTNCCLIICRCTSRVTRNETWMHQVLLSVLRSQKFAFR